MIHFKKEKKKITWNTSHIYGLPVQYKLLFHVHLSLIAPDMGVKIMRN